MSLDEQLFTWIWRRSKVFRQSEGPTLTGPSALLSEQRRSLEILLHGLLDRVVPIESADDQGGWLGDTLLLPARIQVFNENADNVFAYRFRVLNEAAMWLMLEMNRAALDEDKLASFLSLPHLFQTMDQYWPGAILWRGKMQDILERQAGVLSPSENKVFKILLGIFADSVQPILSKVELYALIGPRRGIFFSKKEPSLLWACLQVLFARPFIRAARHMPNPKIRDLGSSVHKRAHEKVGKEAKRPKLMEDDPEANNPVAHVFEKTLTAETYLGGQRNLDDSDDMNEHSDGLDEIDFQQVVRTKGQAGSFINMDHEGHFVAEQLPIDGAPAAKVFKYSEWNDRKQQYFQNWCTVREFYPPLGAIAQCMLHPQVLTQGKRLRLHLESLFNRRLWINRQPDGSELDYDRLVTREVDILAGAQPDDLVYKDKRILCRDFSCVILVDGSLSTDAWINGLRVLDQLKEALSSLALAMDTVGFRSEVAAFHSQTRSNCRYQILKEFAEPWTTLGRRLDTLEPTGYTRIGPAMRHSIARLEKNKARHRLILLLSDAKPTDFDAYEGRHGVKDVRRAVLEAERKEIRVRALTVSASKNRQVFSMFGPGCVHFLGAREELAQQMFEIFLQVLKQR